LKEEAIDRNSVENWLWHRHWTWLTTYNWM